MTIDQSQQQAYFNDNITFQEINSIQLSDELLSNLVPDFITDANDISKFKNSVKDIIIKLKREAMPSISSFGGMTRTEFQNRIIEEIDALKTEYASASKYNYIVMFEELQSNISGMEFYKNELEVLSEMINEFKKNEKIRKSNMLYYNKLYKQIYGETT
jgi:hypothetical protein